MKKLIIKYSVLALLFFFFSLIQASFLPFFSVMGQIPNLVFILFYLVLFFDENDEALFWAVVAGFLLDVFSPFYFGTSILILIFIYLARKLFSYFLKDIQGKYFIVYFIALFSLNFILYNILMYVSSIVFGFGLPIGLVLIVSLVYNIVVLVPGFYMYRFLAKPDYLENQLKLL